MHREMQAICLDGVKWLSASRDWRGDPMWMPDVAYARLYDTDCYVSMADMAGHVEHYGGEPVTLWLTDEQPGAVAELLKIAEMHQMMLETIESDGGEWVPPDKMKIVTRELAIVRALIAKHKEP